MLFAVCCNTNHTLLKNASLLNLIELGPKYIQKRSKKKTPLQKKKSQQNSRRDVRSLILSLLKVINTISNDGKNSHSKQYIQLCSKSNILPFLGSHLKKEML